MARLEFQGKTYTNADEIRNVLADFGVPYERWGVRGMAAGSADDSVIDTYRADIDKLMRERQYVTVDLVALKPSTPNLPGIIAKFDKEHHHVEDEVRFTVEGEGVFEINTEESDEDEPVRLKFTAEPGDLIVIPAMRRHLFYLTGKSNIRCIRLFKTKEGWEALYEKAN